MVLDAKGRLLSAQVAEDEQWRLPPDDHIPIKFQKALLTYEDKRFFYHPGIDPLAISRAVRQNLQSHGVVSGASTITMQLARMALGNQPRTLWQKIKEAQLALRYELWHHKTDILEWYVGIAPYGGNVVGLNAASWRYYRKHPSRLTWAEAATLAVLPNAPSLIHVNKNRIHLKTKRDRLLGRLRDQEIIDSTEFILSLEEPLPDRTYPLPSHAPHLMTSSVRGKITTSVSIDRELQIRLNDILKASHRDWKQNDIQNAAILVIDNENNSVLAYCGNIPDTQHEADVDMIQARRSSGSILKPFLYQMMVNEGLMHPSSMVQDVPMHIDGFQPSNYDRDYRGLIPADQALQRSLNVPFVLMLQQFGVDRFLRSIRKFGITTLDRDADDYGLSVILGGGEVTLWEMVQAYHQLQLISTDNVAAHYTLQAMQKLNRPDDQGDWRQFSSTRKISWKTGTSYGHRDAWAIGTIADVTIGVWVGNADGEGRQSIIGGKLAGKVLFDVLHRLPNSEKRRPVPYHKMSDYHICRWSGDLATSVCPHVDTIPLADNLSAGPMCRYHKEVYVDERSGLQVGTACEQRTSSQRKVVVRLPSKASSWYLRDHPNTTVEPGYDPDCFTDNPTALSIIYPNSGDRIKMTTDLNERSQKVVVQAAHRSSGAKLFWYLDDTYLGETIEWHTMAIRPDKGDHRITIIDQNGNRFERAFEIIDG